MGMKDRFRADRDFIDGVLNDADDMLKVKVVCLSISRMSDYWRSFLFLGY